MDADAPPAAPPARSGRMAARWGLGIASCLLLAAAAAWLVVHAGVYDVGAVTPHWQSTYSLLETAMHRSVERRARALVVPAASEALRVRGGVCFREHCVQCHGAPGVAPLPFALSMQPLPGPLVEAAARWGEAEIYWVTRHGIRMSGMPAWQYRLADDDLWGVAMFVADLEHWTPAQYLEWQQARVEERCPDPTESPAFDATALERGRAALRQHGCHGCHVIDGVVGPRTFVGPALAGIAQRQLLAGRLPTTHANLVRWIRAPAEIEPGTAMPTLPMTEQDATDMAAYLLHSR
jgi:mono/diheme cytochrome c family protein